MQHGLVFNKGLVPFLRTTNPQENPLSNSTTISNSLFTIRPYWTGSTWAFDTPEMGLFGEPFVAGADTIISFLAKSKLGLEPALGTEFSMIFSGEYFPSKDAEFTRLNADGGGFWYLHEESGMKGWLCPATLKFFPNGHPEKLFIELRA